MTSAALVLVRTGSTGGAASTNVLAIAIVAQMAQKSSGLSWSCPLSGVDAEA